MTRTQVTMAGLKWPWILAAIAIAIIAVVIVANLAPRVIRGVESRGMVLAVQDGPEGAVSPLSVSRPVRSGMRVT